MQRLKGRNIVFGALAVLACSGDPTGNESTPTVIQVNPDVVFVTQGDSQPVIVQALDEDGNVLQAEFTATNIGSGISCEKLTGAGNMNPKLTASALKSSPLTEPS